MTITKVQTFFDKVLLGRRGQSCVNKICIDVRPWLKQAPGSMFELLVIPPGSDQPYFADTILHDGILQWIVNWRDTAIAGQGKAQLTMYGFDGQIKRSSILTTKILQSLYDGYPQQIPQYLQPWTDTIGKISAIANSAAVKADQAKSKAEEALRIAQAGGGSNPGGGSGEKLNGKLTIGPYIYDGSEDVTVRMYGGQAST